VFYDSADGEARVLGGGFIRATEAVNMMAQPEAMAANG